MKYAIAVDVELKRVVTEKKRVHLIVEAEDQENALWDVEAFIKCEPWNEDSGFPAVTENEGGTVKVDFIEDEDEDVDYPDGYEITETEVQEVNEQI